MKLLFDQNISFRIAKKLQSYFPGCLHVSECNLSNCEDSEIWSKTTNPSSRQNVWFSIGNTTILKSGRNHGFDRRSIKLV